MKIEELNTGRKIDYELRGTKLDFADSTLVMNLAKYQKEDTVTATITANAQGNLAVDADNGLYYVAQVEIPGYEYEDVEVEGPAEKRHHDRRSSGGHRCAGRGHRAHYPHRAQGKAARHRKGHAAPVEHRRL